ncbi:type VI secretion system membrane subunit TssM [Erwinia sp. J316]|uniref:Type VI secretion system membrane subunit TssM n=2 Tax=Erwinia sorbitola TaxID=2681984 RepID=A0ABW9RDS0_9GAMM|nr:type VI secretion system membrane subunit TssM [Erwinia sorbitola]
MMRSVMSFINRLFSVRVTKFLLFIACFILISLFIWYLGPFFGFGETRPLESIEPRIILIVLTLLCIIGLWYRFPLLIMLLLALCCAVWILGPYILVGNSYPVATVNRRVIVIGCILLVALFYGAWKLIVALRKNPKFLDRFIKDEVVKEDYKRAEIFAIIRNANSHIKNISKSTSRFKQFFWPVKFLSDLPWYMVIGTESAGKTSSILSSGQSFPEPEQLKKIAQKTMPTAICECWFSNDALFLDTAGRYVSHAEENNNEWKNILEAIKKYRSIKAINGIIVNLSVADVMGRSKAELYDISAKIRSRLDETRSVLGIHFPVYVLVSKVDQLSGFSEYFRILTEHEREQIWGVTFPYGQEMETSSAELRERIDDELGLLEKRIEDKMTLRQQEELNLSDRKRMYSLPQDFRVLSQEIAEILQSIFFTSRYDETKGMSSLRGLYFASSSQPADVYLLNNKTLIQRWSNFVQRRTSSAVELVIKKHNDADFLVTDTSYGRHYFLKTLFAEIIVKDARLVRHNLRTQSKYRFQNIFIHSACILFTAWMLNGFYHSFYNNDGYLATVSTRVSSLEDAIRNFEKANNPELIPGLLSMAQYMPEYSEIDVTRPPLDFRFGQYVGWDITADSLSLYQYFLQRLLYPMVQHEALEKLQDTLIDENNSEIYTALKTYLMLNGHGKFDKKFLINTITEAWDSSGKIAPYADREIFISHLDALFDVPEWRRYAQSMDKELVAQARAVLSRIPLSDRLYDRIKILARDDAPANLTLGQLLGAKDNQIFTMAVTDQAATSIPGLFTYVGYHEVFKKKISSLITRFNDEDGWVMESKKSTSLAEFRSTRVRSDLGFVGSAMLANAKRIDPVKQRVMQRYYEEYTQRWSDFLSHIRLRSNGPQNPLGQLALSFDIYLLRTIASTNSPLIKLAQRVVEETTLSASEADGLADNQTPNSRLLQNVNRASQLLDSLEKKRVWEGVDSHFATLREFVTGSARPDEKAGNGAVADSQLRKIMGVLQDQYTLFVISDNALKNGNMPVLSDAGIKIGAESQTWPDPIRNIIEPLLKGAHKKVNHLVIAESNKKIESDLGEMCRNTIVGRYPFARRSKEEVRVSDFERFFAPGGLADTFFRENLTEMVNTSVKPWRYKSESVERDSGTLKTFEQARDIRNIFFRNGESKQLSVNFSISVPYMAPTITQLSLNFDGATMDYSHGPVVPVSFIWPGTRAGSILNMTAQPRMADKLSGLVFTGPWALFHWMDSVTRIENPSSANPVLVFSLSDRIVNIQASGITYNDRLITNLLRNFRCPR